MSFLINLEQICKINSFTKNKTGVDAVGAVMQRWFESIGFETKTFQRDDIGNHQLFTTPKTDGKKILLLGHNDTVFPEGAFDSFHQDDIWVYGPGVCDMKGGNLVAFEALKNIYNTNGIQTIINGYPGTQCRLDQYVAGALCNVDEDIDTSATDEKIGTCMKGLGARTSCWFAPKATK